MKKILSFILFILPSSIYSQNTPGNNFSEVRSRFVRDIAVLASDSMEGRRSGTEGEHKASSYIINQFREAGLRPKGSDSNSFLQPFPVTTFLRDEANNRLSCGKRQFYYLYDFGPTNLTGNGSCEGMVIDLARGTMLTGSGLNNHKTDEAVRGKIALIDLKVLSKICVECSLKEECTPGKCAEAAIASGAIGVIFWNRDTSFTSLFNFNTMDTLKVPVIYANSEVIDYVKKNPGSEIKIKVNVRLKKETFCNVIGFIDNHAPSTIVIGAHYDHMGRSPRKGIRYGADDNASGTAMVMELARYLKLTSGYGNNFLFIAFSGEEEWLLGSSWFCKHPTIDMSKVNFMINFDMVGRLGCEGKKVYAIGTSSSPGWKNIYRSLHSDDFRITKMKGAGEFSDCLDFYKDSIPIAYFTTGFHYDYHTPDDNAERINYDGMVSLAYYVENMITIADKTGRLAFSKFSRWSEFMANLHYFLEELDYILVAGFGGAE